MNLCMYIAKAKTQHILYTLNLSKMENQGYNGFETKGLLRVNKDIRLGSEYMNWEPGIYHWEPLMLDTFYTLSIQLTIILLRSCPNR